MTHNMTFKQVAQTKGAVKYAEVLEGGKLASQPNDPGAMIGTLYVRKSTFGSNSTFPDTLNITVAW